jgi:sugar/nucleoside kinase (ribokinase family)
MGDLCFSLRQFFHEVLKLGPSKVVVTHGSEGVYIGTPSSFYFHAALPVENIVNTLGAGDAFGSSFVAALARGENIENAVRFGLNNSASVIQYHDAKSGLLTLEQLTIKVAQTDPRLCQKLRDHDSPL